MGQPKNTIFSWLFGESAYFFINFKKISIFISKTRLEVYSPDLSGQWASGQLASGQFTSSHLARGQLASGQLASGQLTYAQLASGQLPMLEAS